jgi:hypothetical protein
MAELFAITLPSAFRIADEIITVFKLVISIIYRNYYYYFIIKLLLLLLFTGERN